MTDQHAEGEDERSRAMANDAKDVDGQGTNGQTADKAGAGSPTDAITSIGSALARAAGAQPVVTTDSKVTAAFALGWHMSELYRTHLPAERRKPLNLPGLSELRRQRPLALEINQVQVGVSTLDDLLTKAGLGSIELGPVTTLLRDWSHDDPVLAMHGEMLVELTAAEARIGKAYGLGRALADSCQQPDGLDGLKKELGSYRIAVLLGWLDDLASALPAHSARSVAKSLERWRDTLYPSETGRVLAVGHPIRSWRSWRNRRRRPKPLDVSDVKKVDETVKALRRQGELWRALLSGEKLGNDMLGVDNYLDAARQFLSKTAAIGRGLVRRMPLLVSAVVVLVGGGIWLISKGNTGHLVAGATSVLAGLGLTWKGLGGALGQLAGKVVQPLWGAVLDDAIADAITLLPDNKANTQGRREVARSLAAGRRSPQRDSNQPNATS